MDNEISSERTVRSSEHVQTAKSLATRERILEAAYELIHESGSVDFQMKDLADRCGMSKGSVYYYFVDREDVVAEIFTRTVDQFAARLSKIEEEESDSHEAIMRMGKEFASEMDRGGVVFITMASELFHNRNVSVNGFEREFVKVIKVIETVLKRAQDEGYTRKDIDPYLAALNICGTFFFASIAEWSTGRTFVTERESALKLVSLLSCGIGTEHARESFYA